MKWKQQQKNQQKEGRKNNIQGEEEKVSTGKKIWCVCTIFVKKEFSQFKKKKTVLK